MTIHDQDKCSVCSRSLADDPEAVARAQAEVDKIVYEVDQFRMSMENGDIAPPPEAWMSGWGERVLRAAETGSEREPEDWETRR